MSKRKPLSKVRAESVRQFVEELKARTTIEKAVKLDEMADDFVLGVDLHSTYMKPAPTPPPSKPTLKLSAAKKAPLWKRLLGIA